MTRLLSLAMLLLLAANAPCQDPEPTDLPEESPRSMGMSKGKGKGKVRSRASDPEPLSPTPPGSVPSQTTPPAQPSTQGISFFEEKIRPVLEEKCYNCHQTGRKMKGGLAVDSLPALLNGGDSGPAIVPGDATQSLLHLAVSHEDADYAMPPREQLPVAVVNDFKAWIEMGAPFPSRAASVADAPGATPNDQVVLITGLRGHSITYTVSAEGFSGRGGKGRSRDSATGNSVTKRVAETALITSAAVARRTQDILVGLELSGGLRNAAFNAANLRARLVIQNDEIIELNLITSEEDGEKPIAVKPKRPPTNLSSAR